MRLAVLKILVVSLGLFYATSQPSIAGGPELALRDAMRSCAYRQAAILGNPLQSRDAWADVIAAGTAMSVSMVSLTPNIDSSNIVEEIAERTKTTLINGLSQRGLRNFRSILIDTVDTCMPEAVLAYVVEHERIASAACPDITNYMQSVEILSSSDEELRARFGSQALGIKENSMFMLQLSLISGFPELFRYGTQESPLLPTTEEYEALSYLILEYDVDEMENAADLTSASLNEIEKFSSPLPPRIQELRTSLICFQDWLDVYPSDLVD